MFPKILLMDIETAPISAFVWRVWQENIGLEQIEKDWFTLSWAAKWLYDSRVMGEVLTPKESKEEDDYRIVKKLWQLFNEADIIIAHNGDGFDIPKMNTRFVLWGFEPPSSYRSIDTLKEARKHFSFTHNRLDYLGEVFGVGRKIETDFKLWKACLQGEKKSLDKMLKYNKQDVLLLEEVYLKLRPWIKSHPNLSIFMDGKHCPYCGNDKLENSGKYATQCNIYQSLRCKKCGGISRFTSKTLIPIAH